MKKETWIHLCNVYPATRANGSSRLVRKISEKKWAQCQQRESERKKESNSKFSILRKNEMKLAWSRFALLENDFLQQACLWDSSFGLHVLRNNESRRELCRMIILCTWGHHQSASRHQFYSWRQTRLIQLAQRSVCTEKWTNQPSAEARVFSDIPLHNIYARGSRQTKLFTCACTQAVFQRNQRHLHPQASAREPWWFLSGPAYNCCITSSIIKVVQRRRLVGSGKLYFRFLRV